MTTLYSLLVIGAVGLSLIVGSVEAVPCKGACAATLKKCAGSGLENQKPCCKDQDICVLKTSKYGQCRPRSNPIPASWKGAKKSECDDSPACDEGERTIQWRFVTISDRDTSPFLVDFVGLDECQEKYPGNRCCDSACLANEECVAVEEDTSGDCYLFKKGLISSATKLTNDFDVGDVNFLKCYEPEPLCMPGTREVRKVNPTKAYYSLQDPHSTWEVAVLENKNALESCINICRLQGHVKGPCTGFALGPADDDDERICTLLYNKDAKAVKSSAMVKKWKNTPNSEVYSVSEC